MLNKLTLFGVLVASVLISTADGQTTIAPTNETDSNATTTEPPTNDTTTALTTTTTTTTIVTTTEAPIIPDMEHATEFALFEVVFNISNNNESVIQITDSNLTIANFSQQIIASLQGSVSGIQVIETGEDGQSGAIKIIYLLSRLRNDDGVLEELKDKVLEFDNLEGLSVNNESVSTIIELFEATSQDECNANNICSFGYTCTPQYCVNLCSRRDCNGHGQCQVTSMDGGPQASCSCDSDYDTEWYGPDCEDSRMGKDKVVDIVAGVLGALCCLLLLACIILLVLWRKAGSSSAYALSREGYMNSTYEHTNPK